MKQASAGETVRLYQHSGVVPAGAKAWAVGTAIVIGILGGVIYGVVGLWVHVLTSHWLMMPIELLMCVVFGYTLGAVPVEVLLERKGRSVKWAYGVAGLAVVVGIYSAWAAWLITMPGHGISWRGIFNPVLVFWKIGENAWFGVWNMFWGEAEGWFVRAVWIVEAALIVTMASLAARWKVGARAFCERCGEWTESPRYVLHYNVDRAEQLKERYLSGQRVGLEALRQKRGTDKAWCELYLECCPKCEGTRALTLSKTEFLAEKGSTRMRQEVLLRRLMVTRAQVEEIVRESERR